MVTQSSDGTKYNDQADYERGYDALIAFHNVNATKFKDVYKLSLVGLVKELSKRRGQTFFVEGLGLAIANGDMSKSEAKQAMEILAQKSKGRIPSSNGAFYTALVDESTATNWIDASAFTLVESGKTVLEGTAKVGQAVLSTGEGVLSSAISISKNLEWLIPLIVVGSAGIYVYNMSKK